MKARRSRDWLAIPGLALALFALGGCGASATHRHVEADQTIIGDTVTLTPHDYIRGNLNLVNAHVHCNGATIEGDVRAYFGDSQSFGDCKVRGAVTQAFAGQTALVFAPWLATDPATREAANEEHLFLKIAYGVIVLVMFLLFPMRTRTALDRVEHHPGLAAAVGALVTIAVVPIVVLLMVTVVGIPLIPLVVAALFAMLWIGEAAVALLIGRRFYELVRPQTTPSPLVALIVGVVLIGAAEFLPIVGWAVFAIVSVVGIGCAVTAFIAEQRFTAFLRPPAGPDPFSIAPSGTPPGSGPPMRTS